MTKSDMKRRRAALRRFLADAYGPVVMLDGPEFDGGIVGVARTAIADDVLRFRLVYSYAKLVDALAEANGWSEEDAVDWLEFNTMRSLPYMGGEAPIVVDGLDVSEFAPPRKRRAGR